MCQDTRTTYSRLYIRRHPHLLSLCICRRHNARSGSPRSFDSLASLALGQPLSCIVVQCGTDEGALMKMPTGGWQLPSKMACLQTQVKLTPTSCTETLMRRPRKDTERHWFCGKREFINPDGRWCQLTSCQVREGIPWFDTDEHPDVEAICRVRCPNSKREAPQGGPRPRDPSERACGDETLLQCLAARAQYGYTSRCEAIYGPG